MSNEMLNDYAFKELEYYFRLNIIELDRISANAPVNKFNISSFKRQMKELIEHEKKKLKLLRELKTSFDRKEDFCMYIAVGDL